MSLVEVMMAICLLATVSLGTLTLLPSAFAAERRAEESALATMATDSVLQALRAQPFDSIASTQGDVTMGNRTFHYTTVVATAGTQTKDVTLTLVRPESARGPLVVQTRIFSAAGRLGQE